MKIYTAEFMGHYLGGFALVFARDKAHAHRMLAHELATLKLADKNVKHPPALTLRGHAATGTPAEVVILWNGDY